VLRFLKYEIYKGFKQLSKLQSHSRLLILATYNYLLVFHCNYTVNQKKASPYTLAHHLAKC